MQYKAASARPLFLRLPPRQPYAGVGKAGTVFVAMLDQIDEEAEAEHEEVEAAVNGQAAGQFKDAVQGESNQEGMCAQSVAAFLYGEAKKGSQVKVEWNCEEALLS